ncbi:transposase [Metasolibacillus sp. FSL H7-0170]|uniref:transposase n=1 Tax=Metasolibacillus TaxID=2703677 RepID=UPI000D3532A4|nr:transposase [Metasolibacillus fluoroglycofenilyticus]
MNKYKMYVSITDLTCSHIPNLSSNEFKVELEPAIARIFTKLFNQINGLEGHNLWRAHLPYIPYHYDELNHDIDTRLKKIYALLHEFGDNHTKEFVEQLPYFKLKG